VEPNSKPSSIVDSTVQWATSSPIQQGLQYSSAPQDPTALRHRVVSNLDSPYGRGSQDSYSPSDPQDVGLQTSNSPNNSLQSSAEQPAYSMQNAFFGQGVPDLSAMMFPSADPFAYPKQPMTTLENGHFIKQENPMDPSILDLPGPTTTGAPYDNYDAQIYGQMPPYLMQGQASGFLPGSDSPMGMTSGDPGTPSTATPGLDGGHWLPNQQQRSANASGMGFDQLFGEDWGGWMNPYRQ